MSNPANNHRITLKQTTFVNNHCKMTEIRQKFVFLQWTSSKVIIVPTKEQSFRNIN